MNIITDLIYWLLGGAISVVVWFLKGNIDDVKGVKERLANLHEHYVKKDDFKEFKNELWKRLDKMEEHLSNEKKQSKSL